MHVRKQRLFIRTLFGTSLLLSAATPLYRINKKTRRTGGLHAVADGVAIVDVVVVVVVVTVADRCPFGEAQLKTRSPIGEQKSATEPRIGSRKMRLQGQN